MRHVRRAKPNSNRPVAIEVAGEPLGVVVLEEHGYRFVAVRFNAFAIDGRVFESVDKAREAARQTIASAGSV